MTNQELNTMPEEPKKTLFDFTKNDSLTARDALSKLSHISKEEFKKNFTKYSYLLHIISKDETGNSAFSVLSKFALKFKCLEKVVLKNKESAYKYLSFFPKSIEAEQIICSNPEVSFMYALEILNSRFELGEKGIFNELSICQRLSYCIKTNYRNEDFENILFNDEIINEIASKKVIYDHLHNTMTYPDFSKTLITKGLSFHNFYCNFLEYVKKFIKTDVDNPDYERKMNNFHKVLYKYSEKTVNYAISNSINFCYGRTIINRIPELEETIKKDIISYNNKITQEATAISPLRIMSSPLEIFDFSEKNVLTYISHLEDIRSFKEGYDFCLETKKISIFNSFVFLHKIAKQKSDELENRLLEIFKSEFELHPNIMFDVFEYIFPHKKERFPKLEELIFKTPKGLFLYAEHLNQRLPEAEEIVFNKDNYFNNNFHHSYENINYLESYFKKYVNSEFKLAEDLFSWFPATAITYSIITKKRFKKAEPTIFSSNNPILINDYIINLIINSADGKIPRIVQCEKIFTNKPNRRSHTSVDYSKLKLYVAATNTRIKKIEKVMLKRLKDFPPKQAQLELTAILDNYAQYVFFGEPWEELERIVPNVVSNDVYKGILSNGTSKPKRQRRKSTRVNTSQESQS